MSPLLGNFFKFPQVGNCDDCARDGLVVAQKAAGIANFILIWFVVNQRINIFVTVFIYVYHSNYFTIVGMTANKAAHYLL